MSKLDFIDCCIIFVTCTLYGFMAGICCNDFIIVYLIGASACATSYYLIQLKHYDEIVNNIVN